MNDEIEDIITIDPSAISVMVFVDTSNDKAVVCGVDRVGHKAVHQMDSCLESFVLDHGISVYHMSGFDESS